VILVDTSVWVDHLRAGDDTLVSLLENRQVVIHPFVVGELALGNIRQRANLLAELQNLPQARAASDQAFLRLIELHELFVGIGYVDAHLLAAVRLTAGASLWTRDKRLLDIAAHLGMASGFDQ
jgi:predicted nucleic acid-binding protein